MMNVFFERKRVKDFSELEKGLIAFGIGLTFDYFLFYPPTALMNFWWPFLGNNAYLFSTFLFCAVSASALFCVISGESKTKITRAAQRILLFSVVCMSVVTILFCSIGLGATNWYPSYVLSLVSQNWNSFMASAIVSLLLFVIGFFFLSCYLLYPLLKKPFEIKIRKVLTRRNLMRFMAVVTTPLIVGLLIVPFDTQLRLFTPHMLRGPELLSPRAKVSEGFEKVVFISATRGTRENISASYQYYALLETTYNITLPMFRFLSSIYIDNPSNTSFSIGEGYPFAGSTEDWKRLYIDTPGNVTYKSILQESKTTGLVFSFGNYSGDALCLVTLTYWQEVDSIDNVRIDYGNLTFCNLGNNTWTETHTILLTNNSNDTLFIPAMEYDCFNMDYVIRNSTSVYLNGNLLPWAELFWPIRLSLYVRVQPRTVSNVTISFLATRNPE
jgi:hypothetical protein